MKHQSSIASTIVVHDSLLLTAPRLDAPALVWIPAGTTLQPLAVQHGFFTITLSLTGLYCTVNTGHAA
jgi:hypothetical protein